MKNLIDKDLKDIIIKYSFKYYNHEYFPNDVSDKKLHFNLFIFSYCNDKKIDYSNKRPPTFITAGCNHYEILNIILNETKREKIDDFEFYSSYKLIEIMNS